MPGFDIGCMKCWEKIWSIGHVKGYGGGVGVCINDDVWAIKAWHKFGRSLFAFRFVVATAVKCA